MTIYLTCKNTQITLSRKAIGQAINMRTTNQHMELQQDVIVLPMTKSTVLGAVSALPFLSTCGELTDDAQVVSTKRTFFVIALSTVYTIPTT